MSDYSEGSILTLKKSHPCGSKDWIVTRVGWEYRLRCSGCDRVLMVRRDKLQKLVRKVSAPEVSAT